MKCWMWNVDWINSTVVLLDNLWIAYRYGANLAKLVVKTSHSQRYDYIKQPLPPVWMMHINPTPSFYQFMDVSEIARRHLSIFPSLRNRKKQNCFDLSSPPPSRQHFSLPLSLSFSIPLRILNAHGREMMERYQSFFLFHPTGLFKMIFSSPHELLSSLLGQTILFQPLY